jgi:hypothetical protein
MFKINNLLNKIDNFLSKIKIALKIKGKYN